jgi:hypothetical protein
MTPDDLDRRLECLEQLLKQLAAKYDTHLTHAIAGMGQANGILAQRLEHAEDLILALDNRLAAVEAVHEPRDGLH